MKQVLAGLGLLAGAAIGTVALAPAGGADPQGWTKLDAAWAPNPSEVGETVTLTPSQPCGLDEEEGLIAEGGEVVLYFGGSSETISVPMDDDGMWEYTAEGPEAPMEANVYKVVAECRNSVWAEEQDYCEFGDDRLPPGVTWNEEDEVFELASYSKPAAPTWKFDCLSEYYAADLTVGGPDTPPTTAPPTTTPPPATPIVRPPNPTG